MKKVLNLVFTIGLLASIVVNAAELKPVSDSEKVAPTTDTDDRINLNYNRGHAHAAGPIGSYSGSDVETYGIEAGIRGPGNYHRPLFANSGGRGSSYAQGPYAPQTWANGNSRYGNGQIGGNVNAGFQGGQGVANTQSLSQHIEIPLDAYGTVLYSNLKPETHGKKPTTVLVLTSSDNSKPSPKEQALQFE